MDKEFEEIVKNIEYGFALEEQIDYIGMIFFRGFACVAGGIVLWSIVDLLAK